MDLPYFSFLLHDFSLSALVMTAARISDFPYLPQATPKSLLVTRNVISHRMESKESLQFPSISHQIHSDLQPSNDPAFCSPLSVSFPVLVLHKVLYSFPMHMLKRILFFTQHFLTQHCLLFNLPNCFLLQQLLNTKVLLVDLFFPCHFLCLSHSD